MQNRHNPADWSRTFVFRGGVPLAIGLLIAAPLLLATFSVLVFLLLGASALAIAVPAAWRKSLRRRSQEPDCIELSRDEYTRLDEPAAKDAAGR